MNILDRYKFRILKQLNISTEAWWDDWYDQTFDSEYMDHGEVDVWEEPELPKTLGIKSPVWTELLTRGDDDMVPYRNIGGNSGVSEYDSGVDWFLIKFKDGSLYLYTHASTLPERIYRMRELANSGTGLNAYVNHMYHRHGIQYAGRNYKGRITLQPGIESISDPKGIRALQLIQAFQNTLEGKDMNTIANEKFEEVKEKAGKDGLEPVAQRALKITEYLMTNPTVANEGFWSTIGDFFSGRPTSVKMKGDSANLQNLLRKTIMDKTWLSRQSFKTGIIEPEVIKGFDVRNAPRFVDEFKRSLNTALQHNKNELRKVTTQLRAVENFFASSVNGHSVVNTSVVDGLLATLNPWQFNTNLNLKEPELLYEELFPTPMEALTQAEVVKFAGMLDDVQETRLRFAYASTLQKKHYVSDVAVSFSGRKPENKAVLPKLKQLVTAYNAIINRVNTNIVNGTKTHALSINSENISDSLINCMSKSITNINNTGFENHTVSNEGIWGAVRYLFGGNYEDLPKINAAYDEAVDAVKATYGNPEWVKKRRLKTGHRVKVKGCNDVAANPEKTFTKVKQNNAKSFEETRQYVKEEVEYLTKFAKALNGDSDKVKALLDMFEIRPKRQLEQAPDMDLGSPGDVAALDKEGMLKAAGIFEEAIKYRRASDAVYSSGLYKLLYTDSGKERFGVNGMETARLEGAAKELSIAIGKAGDNVQESFYSSFSNAWENIDGVVRGTLWIMEASAN